MQSYRLACKRFHAKKAFSYLEIDINMNLLVHN